MKPKQKPLTLADLEHAYAAIIKSAKPVFIENDAPAFVVCDLSVAPNHEHELARVMQVKQHKPKPPESRRSQLDYYHVLVQPQTRNGRPKNRSGLSRISRHP